MAGPIIVEPRAPLTFPKAQMPTDRALYISARRARPKRPTPQAQEDSQERTPAHLAARMGDVVAHTAAWAGFGWGALIGALIGVAFGALLIVATGGLGAIAIGAMIAAGAGVIGGAAGGALAGAAIGETFPGKECSIIDGGPGTREAKGCSPDTKVVKQFVARAGLDTTTHSSAILCEGSATVIVNNKPLARLKDKVKCSGMIKDTLTNKKVIVGGPTIQVVKPDPAIPEWVTKWTERVGLVAGIVGAVAMAPAVGVAGTILGFAGSMVGGMVGGWGGQEIGGWIGKKFGNEERGRAIGAAAGGFLGSFAGGMAGTKAGTGMGKARVPVLNEDGSPKTNMFGRPVTEATNQSNGTKLGDMLARADGRVMRGQGLEPQEGQGWYTRNRNALAKKMTEGLNKKAFNPQSRTGRAAAAIDNYIAKTRIGRAIGAKPVETAAKVTDAAPIEPECKTCAKAEASAAGGGEKPVVEGVVNEAMEPAAGGGATTPLAEVKTNSQLEINSAVRGSDRATLRAALKDPEVAARLAKEGGTSPKRVQRDAAILLSRDSAGPLTPGQPISREQFEYQAGLLGHEVETLPEVYRLDARTPAEIVEAGGFKPNPGKENATLWEHTAEQVAGGGNLVSTSTDAAHRGTLLNPDFFEGTPVRGTNPLEVKQGTSVRQTPEDFEYVRYEYRIRNAEGVVLKDGVGVAIEKEAVIREASPDQIDVREIRVKQRWQERADVDEDGTSYWYELTSIKKIADSDVSIGDWAPITSKGGTAKAGPAPVLEGEGNLGGAKPGVGGQAGEGGSSAKPGCSTCGDAVETAGTGGAGGGGGAPKDPVVAVNETPGAQASAIEAPSAKSAGESYAARVKELPANQRRAGGGSAVVNKRNGKVYERMSGGGDEPLAPQMKEAIEKGFIMDENGKPISLRDDGSAPSNCAEFKAANQALLEDPSAQLSDLEIYNFRPRNGQPIHRCPNCMKSLEGAKVVTDTPETLAAMKNKQPPLPKGGRRFAWEDGPGAKPKGAPQERPPEVELEAQGSGGGGNKSGSGDAPPGGAKGGPEEPPCKTCTPPGEEGAPAPAEPQGFWDKVKGLFKGKPKESVAQQPHAKDPGISGTEQSRQFLKDNRINGGDRIVDGYKDGGGSSRIADDGTVTSGREINVVDRVNDPALEKHLEYARSLRDLPERQRADMLQDYVDQHLSPGGRRAASVEDTDGTSGWTAGSRNKEVMLGDVLDGGAGVCRHRSLAYKVLGDEAGLNVSLQRGILGGEGKHAWNEVTFADGHTEIYDVMNPQFSKTPTDGGGAAALYTDMSGTPIYP